MAKTRPTLSSVAQRAGVSVSTASLAFSGAGPITPETRDRVLAAAAELGYHGPNPFGRQLRSGRSGIVGVVLGTNPGRAFSDPVAVQLLDGLVSSLGEAGLGVLLIPGLDGESLLGSAAMDAAVMVWGVISSDPSLEVLTRRHIPVVVGEGPKVPGAALVGLEDQAAMRDVATHLVSLGHTKIAELTLPLHRTGETSGFVDARRLALADRVAATHRLAGLREVIEPVATWEAQTSTVASGREGAHALLDLPDEQRPTAIVAQSDVLAAGVVLALRERGLVPGKDVSITGFDALDLPWLTPDVLTTVSQPLREKGALLGQAVLNLLDGGEPTEVYLPVELKLGTTTGPKL
ncbi:MAG: LacI family DNA-binding transcriptional regulator [Cellulomonadaceae bacterium]|jgi:DNA-binding LacI/PurR family transcriptional regulator|nr:LacI family DNA-binding transcriptional regulator [Cellulomonadaceae bacterium]